LEPAGEGSTILISELEGVKLPNRGSSPTVMEGSDLHDTPFMTEA